MKKYNFIKIILISIYFLSACAQFNPPADTPTATLVPPTATNTPKPTSTPRPTQTPNVVQTQNYDDIFSKVQQFKDEGLIPSTNGTYQELDDFTETVAQRGYLVSWYFKFNLKHFVYKSHVRWSTAGDTSDTSGCGIVFGIQPEEKGGDYYGIVVDKKRIFASATFGNYYYDMGKSRGTGKLDFGNPAEADLTLLVYDYKALVYINDEFIGEYSLSKDKPVEGRFGYGIISGTNRDYGTRCELTNARLWKLKD